MALAPLTDKIFQPLDVNTPVVDRLGMPTPAFVRHQQSFRKVLLAQGNDNAAAIIQEGEVRAEADYANALLVDQVTAEALGFTAAIMMKMEVEIAPGDVFARYKIVASLDPGGDLVTTGMYFDIVEDVLNPGQYVGQITLDADKLKLGRVNEEGTFPFVIDGGVVYIETAVIKDLSLGTAKLSYNAATSIVITGQGGLAGPGGSTLMQSASIFNEYGAVSIDVSSFLNRPSADAANVGDLYVSIQRNAVEITRRTMFYDDNFAYPIAFTHVDYPTVGATHDYDIYCGVLSGLGNWDMKDTVVRLINFKR